MQNCLNQNIGISYIIITSVYYIFEIFINMILPNCIKPHFKIFIDMILPKFTEFLSLIGKILFDNTKSYL